NILNLETGDYLYAGDDLLSYLSRKLPVLVRPVAVYLVTHPELLRKFLEHNIASAHIDGLVQDRVHELDDGLLILTAAPTPLLKLVALMSSKRCGPAAERINAHLPLNDTVVVNGPAFRSGNEPPQSFLIC